MRCWPNIYEFYHQFAINIELQFREIVEDLQIYDFYRQSEKSWKNSKAALFSPAHVYQNQFLFYFSLS